jgi:hypothetical protein
MKGARRAQAKWLRSLRILLGSAEIPLNQPSISLPCSIVRLCTLRCSSVFDPDSQRRVPAWDAIQFVWTCSRHVEEELPCWSLGTLPAGGHGGAKRLSRDSMAKRTSSFGLEIGRRLRLYERSELSRHLF